MLVSSVFQFSANILAFQALRCQHLPPELTFYNFLKIIIRMVFVIPRIFIHMQSQPGVSSS